MPNLPVWTAPMNMTTRIEDAVATHIYVLASYVLEMGNINREEMAKRIGEAVLMSVNEQAKRGAQ